MARLLCLLTLFLASAVVAAPGPAGEWLEAPGAAAAVVLVHGRGQGPDGQVVGPLRRAIAKDAALHTLSLQMPVLATSDYLAYAATFPEAYGVLQAAIGHLVTEKGVKRVYVLGYSMGARMSTAFLAQHPMGAVVGYIGIGVLEGGREPLDANLNIAKLKLPVLDVYADATALDRTSAEHRSPLVGAQYQQVRLSGANHSFSGYEAGLAETVILWLKEQEAGR